MQINLTLGFRITKSRLFVLPFLKRKDNNNEVKYVTLCDLSFAKFIFMLLVIKCFTNIKLL